MNWFRKNFRSCEEENAESGARASTSRGRGKGSNSLDHEIVQLTKLRSGPNEHLSKMVHGKHNVPISTVKMLAAREGNYSGRGRFSSADSCHVLSRYLPVNGPYMVDQMDSRAYVSQFSVDGSLLVAAYQGSHIRIYDVENGWKVRKDILAKSLRWTITDTCLSPDQRYLVYSSLSPIVHIVNVGSAVTQSLANVTAGLEKVIFYSFVPPFREVGGDLGAEEIHDGLDFSGEGGNDDNLFEIFSVKFSTDGRELVAASSVDSLYVYDLATNRLALKILAHEDDVNTVCFADESGHLIYSGSDDSFCKIWDRRCLNWKDKPAGTLIGHLEGITFIDSRGDGRYLISNGKDQTTKLWDIRKMSSNPSCVPRRNYNWDYRQMDYPAKLKDKKHPNDQSLATYKGHSVLQTLIRCYFSPAYSTGQKYIYTGSNDASVYIYDLVSGALVAKLGHHESTVRDCSWHPHYPMMISSSWDGSIIRCEFPGGDATPSPLPRRRSQRRHFF